MITATASPVWTWTDPATGVAATLKRERDGERVLIRVEVACAGRRGRALSLDVCGRAVDFLEATAPARGFVVTEKDRGGRGCTPGRAVGYLIGVREDAPCAVEVDEVGDSNVDDDVDDNVTVEVHVDDETGCPITLTRATQPSSMVVTTWVTAGRGREPIARAFRAQAAAELALANRLGDAGALILDRGEPQASAAGDAVWGWVQSATLTTRTVGAA